MRKRERFIIGACILALGLLITQFVPLVFRLLASFLFFVISYGVSAWALREDVEGIEWVTVVPLPAFYAVSVSLFYFLLPENLLSKIAIFIVFGVGMYALYLTSNIYAVAKVRTIQLLRAAHAVGLFMLLVATVLFANVIFSYHLPFWMNMLTIFITTFPLIFMFLWSIELKPTIGKHQVVQSLSIALILAEIAGVLSFLPSTIWWSSLIITTLVYTVLGLLHSKVIGRLFQNTLLEYVFALGVVFIAFFIFLQWR